MQQKIRKLIAAERSQIIDFLRRLVSCNSFSRHKAGVDQCGAIVREGMPNCFQYELVSENTLGNHHIYRSHPVDVLPILLVGHLDTLCPEEPAFNTLSERGDRLLGPGVNDMKGGLTVLIWSLKILERLGILERFPLLCVFNGDEELGSPSSTAKIFQSLAGKVKLAYVFECGGPAGTVVTTRKGNLRYRLHITGKANHFGNLQERKISAVAEAAHKILALEALNGPDTAANVGFVAGGLAANAVAEHCQLEFEARNWDLASQERTRVAIQRIINNPSIAGVSLRSEEMSFRPPMTPSATAREMFELVVACGKELQEDIIEEKRGGLSDGNWLSHIGIPALDGLGPLGDGDFTTSEYIRTDTLFQRIELFTNVLLKTLKRWY